MADGRLVAAAPATVAARLGPTEATVLLCAHSHQPGLLGLPDGRMVLNPGSVGQPRDGNPDSSYLLLDLAASTLEFRRVPYDIAAAAEAIGL